MDNWNSRVVLVTGATSGFGRAIATRFSNLGATIIAVGRRADRLESLARELHTPVHTMVVDVRDNDQIEAAVAELSNELREIEVLVNNAGLALGLNPSWQTDLDQWRQMIDTNVTGLVQFTRAVLPLMVERKCGHVINIGSTAGNYPYPGGNVYGGTKAFVKMFSLNLRADLQGTGVRVTNIEPGLAETEFSLVRFDGDRDAAKKVYQGMQPLTADDIANAVVFAASQPAHVNINRMEIMPTAQSFGMHPVDRTE